MLGKVVTGEARIFFTEIRKPNQLGSEFFCASGRIRPDVPQGLLSGSEVRPPGFDNGVQLLKLGTADGGLHIGHFQVIPEMGIDIFMVVTYREVTELFAETVFARVVNTPMHQQSRPQSRKELTSLCSRGSSV